MSKFRTASTMIQEWEEASKRIQTDSFNLEYGIFE